MSGIEIPAGRFVLLHYRGTLIKGSVLLAVSQLVPMLGYETGTGWISLEFVEVYSRVLGILFLIALPFCLGLLGTRHYGETVLQSRVWWYLGALSNAVLGAVSVVLGIGQMRLRQIFLAEPAALSGIYLLALLIGMVIGIWVGALAGWVGHLVGRLTLRVGG